MSGLAAAAQVKAPLAITPNDAGVVLTGKIDATARKSFPPPYPNWGSVLIVSAQGGPAGTANTDLTFTKNSFRMQLLTANLPFIQPNREITFTLSFPQNKALIFEGTRKFAGAIGPNPQPNPAAPATKPASLGVTGSAQANQVSSTGVPGPPGPKGNDGLPGPAPALPFLKSIPLGIVLEVDTVLLLLLAALLVWQQLRARAKRSHAVDGKPRPIAGSGPSEQTIQPSPNPAIANLRDDLDRKFRKWESERTAFQCTIADLKNEVASVTRGLSEQQKASNAAEQNILGQFSTTLDALKAVRVSERSSPQSSPDGPIEGDIAIASVINEWLTTGTQARSQLLMLAAQAGITDVHLAEYKDASTTSSNGKPEFNFAFTSDGSWLWTRVHNSDDFWASPADTTFLTMGDAPAMLNKLFDGMQEAAPRFRFKAIYKPCRLQPVAGSTGRFRLVERGVLQLEGASTPSLTKPPDLQRIVRSSQTPTDSLAGGPMGASLAKWIQDTSRQLTRLDTEIHTISEELRTLPSPGSSVEQASSVSQLRDEVARVKLDSKFILTRVEAVTNDLKTLASLGNKSVAHNTPPPLVVALPAVDTRGTAASPSFERMPEMLPAALIAEPYSRPAQAPASLPANPEFADTLIMQQLSSTALEVANYRQMDWPGSLWQNAFDKAAARPDTEPEDTGVPSGEVYLRRVRAYCEELKQFDTSTSFTIVHFQKAASPNQNRIELHRTGSDPSGPGGAICLTCGKPPAWQFAISAGQHQQDILYLLFPKCMLDKSKYASVYSALFENLPEIPFSTADMQGPAVLAYDKRIGFYSVVQKIKQTQPDLAGKALA